ncbi:MAG: hypothetical protein WBB23_11205 [Desulforhopalus sp.]
MTSTRVSGALFVLVSATGFGAMAVFGQGGFCCWGINGHCAFVTFCLRRFVDGCLDVCFTITMAE